MGTLNPQQFEGPWVKRVYEEPGEPGNRTHITRDVQMAVPTYMVKHMRGVMGEMPGQHRNRQGQQWEDFKNDIATNKIQNPIFITVDPGQRPRISEGNHRRDAAVELGHRVVPVHVRYFGHAERENDFEEEAHDWWRRHPQ